MPAPTRPTRVLRPPPALVLAIMLLFGPLAAGAPVGDLPVWHHVPDVLGTPRSFDEVDAPALHAAGPLILFSFHDQSQSEPETVLRVVTPQQEENLHVVLVGRSLWASDGHASDGTPRPYLPVEGTYAGGNARIVVDLHGDSYTLTPDRGAPVTGRSFAHAAIGRVADPIPGEPSIEGVTRALHYPASLRREGFDLHAFEGGWEPFAPDGALAVESGIVGHFGAGHMLIEGEGTLHGLTYVHAPVHELGGKFVAEASFTPRIVGLDPIGPTDHQAVLAGLSGTLDEPSVAWAIVAAPVGARFDRWSLFHVDAEGHRTQVGDTWTTSVWHAVRVHVDEHAGALAVQIDDADHAFLFLGDVGTSTRVAVGDVWADRLLWTGGGDGLYSDLAVHAEVP